MCMKSAATADYQRGVYCPELDICFETVTRAVVLMAVFEVRVTYPDILACCQGRKESAGRHPISGQKLTWYFLK